LPHESFASRLIAWHERHGRHDLPWQIDWQQRRDPYRVWLSEIMLQQTQVATAMPYYRRFVQRFPRLADLAAAPLAEVMALWSGLGYYARARNLHRAAQLMMEKHGGTLPPSAEALAALPGIGRSTAHAIAVVCFGARLPILDGNVKRVLCRVFGVEGFPGTAAVESRLWHHAEELLAEVPKAALPAYIQAQMDLGATLCTRSRPRCADCPLADTCVARTTHRVAELPQPKPRRTLPERSATFLVLLHDECVLLERRPPSGLWGGLLALPELPPGADAATYSERHHPIRVSGAAPPRCVPLATFTHSFSHFRLHITPLIVHVTPHAAAMEPGQQWLPLTQRDTAALPAPVRQILENVYSSGSASASEENGAGDPLGIDIGIN
jgi:A/G-specific adenine glycosylase